MRDAADDPIIDRLFLPDTDDALIKSQRIQRSDSEAEGVDYCRGMLSVRAGL